MVIKGMMDGWNGDEDDTEWKHKNGIKCECDECEKSLEASADDDFEWDREFGPY